MSSPSVPGYAKNNSANVKSNTGKESKGTPIATAEYNPCGWRGWLNNTTTILGVNNLMDLEPPFVAGAFENGYHEATANINCRTSDVVLRNASNL